MHRAGGAPADGLCDIGHPHIHLLHVVCGGSEESGTLGLERIKGGAGQHVTLQGSPGHAPHGGHGDHGRRYPYPHLGEGERGRFGSHRHVASSHQTHATRSDVSVDPCQYRRRCVCNGSEDLSHGGTRCRRSGWRPQAFGQVGAGTKHRAGAGEHHQTRAFLGGLRQTLGQPLEQPTGQGIAVGGAVHGQPGDTLAVLYNQRGASGVLGAGQCGHLPVAPGLVANPGIWGESVGRQARGIGRCYVAPVVETEEHRLFRATLRELFQREISPHVDDWERAKTFPAHQLFPKLGAVGLLGLEYEPEFGGMGADHSFTVVAGEELGRVDCGGVPMAIAVQMAMATPALHRYGSPELKERYLEPAIRGDAVASIAVTEPDAGSDVAGIRTRAVADGGEWVINGSKLYITNGSQADWLCLLARTSEDGGHRGMSLIVVPTNLAGVTVSRTLDKLGMWSSDTAELAFDEVRVPVANTIGKVGRGFQQQMVQFQAERLITLYRQVGSIEQALQRTREYLAARRAFGRPLLANQHIQYTLAELSARHDMLRHYAYAAAEAVMRGEDATRFATIGKLMGSRLQREVADTCLQFHGGMGYMAEHWTSRYYRDTRLDSIGAGADEVMLRILARMDGFSSE